MCLDHGTFLLINGDEEVPLGNIASILPGDGRLRLLDVFGKSVDISGTIGEIDLLNKRIVLA
jgi:predicted RNA-binding protein